MHGTVYVKRLMEARDYFQHIPEEKVRLDVCVEGTLKDCERHRQSYGLDALSCNTVGCLAGWLQTRPLFRDWYKDRYDLGLLLVYDHPMKVLCEFLCPSQCQSRSFAKRSYLVDGPDADDPTISDKTLALRRLDHLIALAQEAGP